MNKITFANLANALESAEFIACKVGTNAYQLALCSPIENDGCGVSFQFFISDGCEGYETVHSFSIEDGDTIIFDDGSVLLMDDEGNAVNVVMLSVNRMDANKYKENRMNDFRTEIQNIQNKIRDWRDNDPDDNDAHWYRLIDSIESATGISPE